MSNVEVVGGIPVISVIGTPRTMGETIGIRLKSRLQVLAQYLMEQLAAAARASGRELGSAEMRSHLRSTILPSAKLEPALWMEIESMARAAEVPEEDLLLVHGFSDLLSHYQCQVPPGRSTFLALPKAQTEAGRPLLVYGWHLDPALFPYITLVRRIPAHGPASLSLTIAGLHPVAGLSEACLAVCSNELRVTDGGPGHFTCHLLGSTLTAPSFDDALGRLQTAPRHGGAAVHLQGELRRQSLELSGQTQALLFDPHPTSPRVHTNHPLDEAMAKVSSPAVDPTSRGRLAAMAQKAIEPSSLGPDAIAPWFGLGGRGGTEAVRQLAQVEGASPETTVLAILDPGARTLHLRRGGSSAGLEAIAL